MMAGGWGLIGLLLGSGGDALPSRVDTVDVMEWKGWVEEARWIGGRRWKRSDRVGLRGRGRRVRVVRWRRAQVRGAGVRVLKGGGGDGQGLPL